MEQKIKTVTDMDGIIINGVYYAAIEFQGFDEDQRCNECAFGDGDGDCSRECPCTSFEYPYLDGIYNLKRIGKVNAAKLQEAIEE